MSQVSPEPLFTESTLPPTPPQSPPPLAAPPDSSADPATAQRRTRAEVWLALTALVFLVAYSVPVISPQLDPRWQDVCAGVVWLSWGVFLVDFLVQWRAAGDRRGFVRHHWLDALALLLPVFQPLRLVRLITLLRVLNRLNKHATAALRGRVTTYVISATSLLVYLGALAVLTEERDGEGAIQTLGDALWWATVTVTTVGYGDYFPVTAAGRLVAVALMVCGIALLGIVTASMATWLLERIRSVEHDAQAATRADLAELTGEVRRLQQQLDQLTATLAGHPSPVTAASRPSPHPPTPR